MKALQIHLYVRDKEQLLYDDDVLSVTSVNEKGVFDVLPIHTNFISLIKDFLTIRETEGGKKELKFTNAAMRVHQDKIEVYIGIKK